MESKDKTVSASRSSRTSKKWRTWLLFVLGGVLLAFGASQIVLQRTADAQTATQVESQIAALPSVTSTATPTPLPSTEVKAVAPPTEASKPPAVPPSKPDSVPVRLTCQRAGINDLPILPLPPQADPGTVDPPVTAQAVFWNASPIVGSQQQFKVGPNSQTTALIQAHFLIGVAPEAGFPFNKLSYGRYFASGDTCTVGTDNGSVLVYRLETSVALTMDQWRADPKFGQLAGPSRGYDLILQACDAADPHVLKRLVGFKLVASS